MNESGWLELHPKAKIALMIKPMIGIIIFSVFMMVPWLAVILDTGWSFVYLLAFFSIFVIVLFSIVIIWAIMFFNRYRFRIGDDAVYINRGILWKRDVMIPYSRIQHTSTTRGPIDILLGLHILNIFTAGTGSVGARFGGAASAFAAEGSIPGLSDPKPFQDAIMSRVSAQKSDGLGGTIPILKKSEQVVSKDPQEPDVQGEMLTELKKIREILENQQ
jgi:membrane protein YdbS with pleckstrin-like domain